MFEVKRRTDDPGAPVDNGRTTAVDERTSRPDLRDNTADDPPSLPLYLAGLIVTLCGILAVTVTIGDPNLTLTTVLLTVIGFVFSFGCRYLKLNLHVAEIMLVGGLAYLVYSAATGEPILREFIQRSQLDLAIIFVWAMTAWSWTLVGDGMVLACGLLSVSAVGLISSVGLDDTVVPCFDILLVSGLFLMGHQHYLQRRSEAPPDQRLDAGRKLWIVQLVAAGVATVLVFICSTMIVVPIRMLFGQMQFGQAIRGLVAMANPIKTQSTRSSTVTATDDGDFDIGTGAGLDQGSETFALVSPSDGQRHYWRGRTFDQYTGTSWQSTFDGSDYEMVPDIDNPRQPVFWVPGDATGPVGDIPQKPGHNADFTASFDIKGTTNEALYTGMLRAIEAPRIEGAMSVCPDGHVAPQDRGAMSSPYVVLCDIPPDPLSADNIGKLRRCGTQFPGVIRDKYLGPIDNDVTTPDDIAYFKQVAATAFKTIAHGRTTEIDKALALQVYVSQAALYTVNVPPLPVNSDHVRAFLQDTRRGYCDMYASAMAVLCRVSGIPARVATGFDPGTLDKDHYILTGNDKHAWVEVYFPGYGWLTFDPTIGTALAPEKQHTHKQGLLALFNQFVATHGYFAPALVVVIVLLLIYTIVAEIAERVRQRTTPLTDAGVRFIADRQYRLMLRAVAGLGARKSPSETPYEHAGRVVSYLQDLEKTLGVPLMPGVVTGIADRFVVVRYAIPNADTPDGVKQARAVAPPEPVPSDTLSKFLSAVRKARLRRLLLRLRGVK